MATTSAGWDFSGQNLTGADLESFHAHEREPDGSEPKERHPRRCAASRRPVLDWVAVYNQWTVFPADFDPAAAGLTLVMSPTGDLDADDAFDAADVDMLANKIDGRWIQMWWLRMPHST